MPCFFSSGCLTCQNQSFQSSHCLESFHCVSPKCLLKNLQMLCSFDQFQKTWQQKHLSDINQMKHFPFLVIILGNYNAYWQSKYIVSFSRRAEIQEFAHNKRRSCIQGSMHSITVTFSTLSAFGRLTEMRMTSVEGSLW